MSIVDIASRAVIEELNVGRGPEQVVLSADGSLGAVNLASESAVRVFQTADVAGTMSDPVTVGTDPSDLAFVEGNDLLAVANSLSLTVSLIDTADPTAPVVLEEYGIGGGFPYGLTYVPSRSEILAPLSPASADAPSSFVTIAVEAQGLVPSSPETISGGAFPLTAAVDADGAFGFIAHITNHQLSIIDLDSGRVRSIAWLTQPGPSYVAVQP